MVLSPRLRGWFSDPGDWDVQLLDVTLDPAAGPGKVHAAYDVLITTFDTPITHFLFNGHPITAGEYPFVDVYQGILHVWWSVDGAFAATNPYATSDGVPEITFANGHHLQTKTGAIGAAPRAISLTRTGTGTYELMSDNFYQGITAALPALTTLNDGGGGYFTLTGADAERSCWLLTNPHDPPAGVDCAWDSADHNFCPAFDPTQIIPTIDPP